MKNSPSVYGSSDGIKSYINQMSHFTFLNSTQRNSAGIEEGAPISPVPSLFFEWPYREQARMDYRNAFCGGVSQNCAISSWSNSSNKMI